VLPDWLQEATKTLRQWRSQSRLASLALHWREERFDGDHDAYQAIEDWRKQDKHLYEYESNLRDKLHRRRRELYRCFAAEMARCYTGGAVLAELNLARAARRRKEGDLPPPIRHNRQLASVSSLRLALHNACGRESVPVVKSATTKLSQTCHECGAVHDVDGAATEVVCPTCGAVADRDVRAAANLLSQIAPVVAQK
jgi:transposase